MAGSAIEKQTPTIDSPSRNVPLLLAYAIPAVVALVVVQFWFRPGYFAAGGDTGPFVRDLQLAEISSFWSHSSSGAGGPHYQISGLPEMAVLQSLDWLGLDPTNGQRILFSIIAVGLALSAVYLARGVVDRPVIAGGVGILVFANPFVLQNHSSLQLWALAAMTLTGGLVLHAARGRKVPGYLLGLASMLASFVAFNPPLLVALILWVVLLACMGTILGGPSGTVRSFSFLARAAPWCLLLNLWWFAPFMYSLFGGNSGRAVGVSTDVGGWSFTHARASLTNVTTLSSAWGWDLYFDYAARLDRPGWTTLKFGLPVVAFSGPFFADKRRRISALGLALAAVGLIFLSKGLHEPLTEFSRKLFEVIPGMWLFREPAPKFGNMLLLVYLLLVAIAIDHLFEERASRQKLFKGALIGSGVLLAATAIYPTPLWTGAVLSGNAVRVPAEWYTIADSINRSDDSGKVMILPLDDYYQVPTRWGYYGVDSIPSNLLTRASIKSAPGGYYQPPEVLISLIRGAEQAIASSKTELATDTLRTLGATTIVVRHDIETERPDRDFTDPRKLTRGMRTMSDAELVYSGKVADVYVLSSSEGGSLIETYGRTVQVTGPIEGTDERIAGLPRDVAAVPGNGPSLDVGTNPEIQWSKLSSSEYEVDIPSTRSPFVLELKESFAPGWELEGAEGPVEHFSVNGYANGWLVPAGEPGTLRLRFTPDRWTDLAMLLSSITLIGVLGMVAYQWIRNRRDSIGEPARTEP